MTTRHAVLLTLALAALGCAASPDEERPVAEASPAPLERPAAEAPPADAEAPEPDRVEPLEDELDEDAAATPPVDPPPAPEIEAGGEGEPASEPAPAPAPEAATLPRPDWWFEGVRRDEERVALCAEAAGPTVRDARRAAIAAARREIDRALDGALEREVVSMAMVLPLPAADAGPGAARYIGYVMMEARLR